MIERSIRRQISKSPTHSIAGYRVGSGSEVGNGLIDGLILLICAVGQQALESKCKCDGCKRWIDLYKDWGMEDNDIPTHTRHNAITVQRDYNRDYDE